MKDAFIFDSYDFEPATGAATFRYVWGAERFAETLTVHGVEGGAPDEAALDRALFSLHLGLGVSYWKATCAPQMEVRSGALSEEQAAFWTRVYEKGLGEFFYQNEIDFRGLVRFPGEGSTVESSLADQESSLNVHESEMGGALEMGGEAPRVLVPMGGGKDSLVTVEHLRQAGVAFDAFTVNRYPIIDAQIERLGVRHYWVERCLDPRLFELNEAGAPNGHVPISMIYGLSAVLVSVLAGHSFIALSNEHSANEGNVEYLGSTINHQWSKSAEFETHFRNYVHRFITPTVTYFSLLRPFYEIAIARRFAQTEEWLDRFTSCNRNFRIAGPGESRWCGTCPKCLFVFIILAPFVSKERLVAAFGANLLAEGALQPLFEELLGLRDVKPFDCVGTPEEVAVALAMTQEKGEYEDDVLIRFFATDVRPELNDLDRWRKTLFRPQKSPDDFHLLNLFLTQF